VERWLVDGMNVIGSRPDGWWRDRGAAMRALVDRLARFAAAGDRQVTVVFDGRPRDLGPPARPAGAVEVRFAPRPGRNAADDAIAALVAADDSPHTLHVVTSDGALAERVRAHGAVVEPGGSFRRHLDEG
jgi:predicted RNA-binding protein with PIN domain